MDAVSSTTNNSPVRDVLLPRLHALISTGAMDEDALRLLVQTYHPVDFAEALAELNEEACTAILNRIDTEARADILSHLHDIDEHAVEDYIEDVPVSELVQLVDESDPDDAVDLLEAVDEAKAEAVIDALDSEHAEEVRRLRTYAPDTAGGIMTTDFLWVRPGDNRARVIERLEKEEQDVENVETLLVCDPSMKLLGVLSVSELLTARESQTAAELMDRATVNVVPGTDQEICARLMMKYDLAVLPVVDARRCVVGIITHDDIIDVVDDEAGEDMYRLAGVGDNKPLEHGSWERAIKRLPWLAATLIGSGLIGPLIMHRWFEVTLQHIVILAFFLPVIAGIGGNTAIQCSTIAVRGLALGELEFRDILWMLRRELTVAIIIAVVCSAVIVGFSYAVMAVGLAGSGGLTPPLRIAGTIGISMFIGILFAGMLGTSIPMLCHRMGADPAVASGPFITTFIDIASQGIYLGLATWLLMPG